jgi:hypothetical protein
MADNTATVVSATILLEPDAYEQLRRAAFEDHRSMSAIVREALAAWMRDRIIIGAKNIGGGTA